MTNTVEAPRLFPVSGRAPLGQYLQQIWDCRHFIRTQAFAKASTRNGGMLLGNMWMVLSPLLDALGYFVIFALILKAGRGVDNFPGFIVVGITLFVFTSQAMTGACGVLKNNKALIRAFTFPRIVLVLAMSLRDMVLMVPSVLVVVVFIVAMPPHELPTVFWLLFPAVLVLQIMFNLGLSLILARISDSFPDVRQLVGFFTRFWMYLSGVMFSIDRFVDHPAVQTAMQLNPAYQVLTISRSLLMYEFPPTESQWLILAAWSVGSLVIGFLFFWRGEATYGRDR